MPVRSMWMSMDRPHLSVPLPVMDSLLSVQRVKALPVCSYYAWNRQDHHDDQQHDRQFEDKIRSDHRNLLLGAGRTVVQARLQPTPLSCL
jgi:hypothetical protein